jgi:hypothetical protein
MLSVWLSVAEDKENVAAFALFTFLGLPRNAWRPVLTDGQVKVVRRAESLQGTDELEKYDERASCMVAFHAGNVWPEDELAKRLVKLSRYHYGGRTKLWGRTKPHPLDAGTDGRGGAEPAESGPRKRQVVVSTGRAEPCESRAFVGVEERDRRNHGGLVENASVPFSSKHRFLRQRVLPAQAGKRAKSPSRESVRRSRQPAPCSIARAAR